MRIPKIIVAVLFVVGCVTFIWAQQPTTTKQSSKKAGAEKILTLAGEIVSVDTTGRIISVKQKSGKTETFKIDSKATFKKAGKIITLKDLAVGEKVSLGYKPEAGEKIATRITIKVSSEKKEHGTKKY